MDSTAAFTGKADIYAKYRPSYPADYLNYLFTECGLRDDSVIADIGAGTGILTRQLLDRGLKVFAVEPNRDMRKAAERGLVGYHGFTSVNGTAEETGLPDESVDLITSAQAFHWFDTEWFRTECIRILKPEAKAALVWNCRDDDSPMVREMDAVCRDLCPDFKGFSSGNRKNTEMLSRFFRDGIYVSGKFPNNLKYDWESFIGWSLSSSYAPRVGDPHYREFADIYLDIFHKYAGNSHIVIPNYTQSYIGKV